MENQKLTCIGFDADDTLWHNEQFFQITQQYLKMLLADFCEADHLSDRLLEAEKRNLKHFGFGVKGFTLSMIETAIEVSGGKVPAEVIGEILKAGKDMLSAPVQLLPHAGETLEALAGDYTIVLITKGDLFDQERKLAQSGLGEFFDAVEIVSDKNPDTYLRIFGEQAAGPANAMMVGNSLKSDVIPALDTGAWGVHVPHETTWALEHAEKPSGQKRFFEIPTLAGLAAVVDRIG